MLWVWPLHLQLDLLSIAKTRAHEKNVCLCDETLGLSDFCVVLSKIKEELGVKNLTVFLPVKVCVTRKLRSHSLQIKSIVGILFVRH